MKKKTVLTFFAAGMVSLFALGDSGTAGADQRDRHTRFESPRRQVARQEIHQNRREIGRDRTEFSRDVSGRHGRFEHPERQAARQEIHQDRREIFKDRAELNRDLREYNRDREALQRAYRRGASPAELERLRNEVRQGRQEIFQDRGEIRDDYAELRRDLDQFGLGNGGWQGNRGRSDRNDQGWWNWGNGWWNNSRDGRGFDYRRD